MSVQQRLYPEAAVAADGLLPHVHMRRFLWNLGLQQRGFYATHKHERAGNRHKPPADVRPMHGPRPSLFIEPQRALAWVEPVWNADGLSYEQQAADLTELRAWSKSTAAVKAEWGWIVAGSVEVQQKALRSLHRAWENWWGGTHEPPTFKKRSMRDGGFEFKNPNVRRIGSSKKWCEVNVPKVGWVRFRLTRSFADVAGAKTARVRLQNTRWTVSFQADAKPKIPGPSITGTTGELLTTGIDRGTTNTVALPDGRMLSIPTLTAAEQTRYVALQRRLAGQRKGSNRRSRTLDQRARLRQRLLDRRKDWIEQTTTMLAREFDGIVLERLNTAGMTKRPAPKPDPEREGAFLPNSAKAKAALNRLILASCWDQFETRLEHKTHVVYVNPAYTSQQCFKCKHVAEGNRESQAVFACQACNHTEHADINASRNIHEAGKADLVALIAAAQATANPGTPEDRTPVAARRHRVSTNSEAA